MTACQCRGRGDSSNTAQARQRVARPCRHNRHGRHPGKGDQAVRQHQRADRAPVRKASAKRWSMEIFSFDRPFWPWRQNAAVLLNAWLTAGGFQQGEHT